jgi:hypothetical protein
MKIHPKITLDLVVEAVERDDMDGFCTACGEQTCDSVEPDAREYECHACGEFKVYGAAELLFHLA